MTPVELRYRALTHHNPGRCLVTLVRARETPWTCLVRDCDDHLGPPVRTAVRAVAAVIQRELIPPGIEWQLLLPTRAGGLERVEWGESFGGWFAHPRFVPLQTVLAAPRPPPA